MYGFPKSEELIEIVNNNLIQIACTINQIYLHFDKNITITCENPFAHIDDKGVETVIKIPLSSLKLMALLECSVTSIELVNKSTMIMNFSNGCKIKLIENKFYESFNININSKVYWV
jgi:hypothetical protein